MFAWATTQAGPGDRIAWRDHSAAAGPLRARWAARLSQAASGEWPHAWR